MNKTAHNIQKRQRRHARIRSTISGTAERPRLSVYKSNSNMFVQLIDDSKAVTLVSMGTNKLKGTLAERAIEVGAAIAKDAKAKGIEKVVFDRGGFAYTGVIASLAESARKHGLVF